MNVLYGWRRSIGGFLEECVPIVCPSRSGGGGQHLNALGVVPGGLSHIKFDVGGLKRVLASGLGGARRGEEARRRPLAHAAGAAEGARAEGARVGSLALQSPSLAEECGRDRVRARVVGGICGDGSNAVEEVGDLRRVRPECVVVGAVDVEL